MEVGCDQMDWIRVYQGTCTCERLDLGLGFVIGFIEYL